MIVIYLVIVKYALYLFNTILNLVMNTIWTFGNNDWTKEFKLSKLEIMTAFASVMMWKYFYPNDKRILYCDNTVKSYFDKIGLSNVWDEINTEFLQEQDSYNRKVFWTIDKIRLFQHLETPFTFLDLDFYIKQKLPEYNHFDFVTQCVENTKGYYPYYNDKAFESLTFPSNFTFKDEAYNTCFFYVKNPDVTKQYTDMCLSMMKQINNKPNIHGGHSVFLEQTILTELSKVNGWNYSPLVNQKWFCIHAKWEEEKLPIGLFSAEESKDYFVHLNNDKRRLSSDDTLTLVYQSEILILLKNHIPKSLPILFQIISK